MGADLRLIALLLLLFFVQSAWAADAECGYDTDHNGSITLCSNGDNDRDGFTTAQGDCDDTSDQIYPGRATSTGCSANEAKDCPLSGTGTYSACSSGGWKPEGCTTPFYIATTGNNSNAGTVAAPWLNYLMFVTRFSGGAPAGARDPVAGDCFIFRTGTYSDTYTYDAATMALFIRNKDGTAGSPIQIAAFPGEVVNFDPSSAVPPIAILQSDYFRVIGVQAHDTNGVGTYTGNNGAINFAESPFGRMHGNTIYNIDGNQAGNLAGIHTNDCDDCQVTNNIIYDVYDRTNDAGAGTTENNSGIVDFNSNNLRIARNKITNTATGESNCIKKKHTNTTVTTRAEIDWNYCYKTIPDLESYALGFSGAVNLHHNKTAGLGAGNYSLSTRDFGGPANFSIDSVVEYNDFDAGINYRPSKDSSGGATTFANFVTRYNLIQDARASGNIISFCPDGTEAYYTDLVTGAKVTWNNNCYDLPNIATFPYDVFGNPSGGTTYCGVGSAGASGAAGTTFAGWAETGASETSFTYDSNGVPSACATRGRFVNFGAGGGGGGGSSSSARKGQKNGSARKGQK
jgi:hypothetical protein